MDPFVFMAVLFAAACHAGWNASIKRGLDPLGSTVAISLGWPIISLLILCVAFSMSELASAFPTAGGIYYCASKLGGPGWGWFTGWFNLVGLIGIIGAVGYGLAIYATAFFNLL